MNKALILFVIAVLTLLIYGSYAQGQTKKEAVQFSAAKATAVSAPRVEYPYEARAKGISGTGFYILHLNPQGSVVFVQIVHSSGHRILDREAVSTLKRWRFKPGPKKVRFPLTWSLP